MGLEQDIPSYRTCGVSFSTYSSEEVKKLSVKEITNPNAFDALLHPTYSGLYDPALGPVERNDACATCGLGSLMCPGHMGHITLPLPVYNPVLFKTMTQILKLSCFHCKRLRTKPGAMEVLISQLKLLDHGYISEVQQLDAIYSDILLAQGGEDATQQPLQTQLHQFMQSTLAGGDQSAMCKEFYIRNVTDYKQMLVRDFLAGKKYVKGQKCTHCKAMNRQLRTELGLKIFFQGGKKKPPRRPMPRLPPIAKRKSVENEENIDPEYVEMDNEETEKNRETQKAVHEDQSYLTQIAVRAHLREVWKADGQVLGHILGLLNIKLQDPQGFPTDIFFLDVIPVPPSRFRPLSVMGDMKIENPQSANLGKVLKASYVLTEVLSEKKKAELSQTNEGDPDRSALLDEVMGDNVTEKLQNAWNRLQTHVNGLVDSDQDKMTPLNEKKPGIKQLIEKKEGLFRKHMMGKRVNYAARSVISPDPYINTNEIGIPDIFAKKLTYPEPVTPFNFQELKQAVMNGPQVHPGATLVQNEDGTIVRLNASNATQREAIAKQLLTPSSSLLAPMGSKIVHRHLRNGDVLLLNRQPTLHRPSIQAHKARVLTGERTLRLHYANCKAYNADFDGDEMNAHFPQSERARAEAYCIACTDYQYLVPKDGSPLAGLIQDHMVAGVMLTLRGRFFTREEYQQLVFSALTDKRGRVTLLWPSILKPSVCWSGKQVLSTVLLNIIPKGKVPLNLKGKAKISSKQWVTGGRSRAWEAGGTPLVEDDMSESEVVIRGGELLVGVLDKGHYGATPYGLVHSCYELYGGEVAGMLLTCLAKLFTSFLQQVRGFSLGVEDILCTRKADLDRRQAMKTSDQHGLIASARVMGVGDPQDVGHLEACLQAAQFSKDGGDMKDLDLAMKSATDDVQNKISKACIPHGLEKPFPHNNLQLMVQAGAKGSMVNCMQISCLLGQIELEGRRPPLMMSGQSLPSFMPYDTSPRAGGFVDGRFLTGIRPQEYFFHCMAGREGLIDTAVKTSRSGYLQRCLIKHLEGLVISYDMSVRDSDGSVVQFLYGEDGLEITKTPFLKENQFEFLISNKEAVVSTEQMEEAQQHMNCDRAPSLHRALKKWKKKKRKKHLSKRRGSGFLTFCQKKFASVIEEWPVTSMDNSGRSKASTQLIHRWNNLEADKKHKYTNHSDRCPDPVLSQLSPVRYLGCVSEKFEEIIDNYMIKDPCQLLSEKDDNQGVGAGISEDRFRSLLYLRSAMALGQPGEAVGLVAAQSIGEPSTQMTLNTFHFAGRGEMNVTLGIPRLREILMVASANIKTPSMDIPVSPKLQDFSKAEKLKLKLNKAYLSEVLEDIEVKEVVSVRQPGHKCRLYKIRFSFLPPEYYREQFLLTPSKILNHMELRFLPRFADAIKKKMLEMEKSSLLNHGTTQQRERRVAQQADGEQDDDMSDDDQHDGDATATRSRQRQQEDQDYQGEEEEREEIGVEEEEEEESDNDNVAEEVQEGEGGSEGEESDPESSRSTTPVSTPASQRKAKKKAAKKDQARISRVVHTVANMVDYDYDAQSELWCKVTFKVALSTTKVDMMSLIEAEAKKATVHHTPCINRGFLVLGKGQSQPDTMLKTEGVNIQEMYKHDTILDLNRLYTNDIHAMAQQYGIEAACRVIIKEIRDVFAAYGIGVDYRHLSLVADYMTFEGVYKAFNRAGLESNPSPLQKMTFETTMNFLKSATIMGAKDELKSPSAKLVVGRLVGGGTGCFSLIQPLR